MTERQRAEHLHRDRHQKDISNERWGDREWRSYISEERQGDRGRRSYIGISQKRERGREEKRKSRDLSDRSLKTDWETESRDLHRDLWKERERKRGKEKEQRSE